MQVPVPEWSKKLSLRTYVLIAAGLVALQALVLLALGQPAICACGTVRLWHGSVLSAENSQQLTDWYTYSHVIHGFGFYLLLWLVAPRLPVGLRFAIALGLEAGWEVIENTPFIIDRYRETALAQGYVGDSVINSVFDTMAAGLGFALARLLPYWAPIGLAIAMEIFVGFMIRDNLTLNIIQLVWPSEAISAWQAGG
ncbi:MAG: DUF2585 domain-containing protein [Hyphomicrobiales bacterium]|nr:DUF2585 domain-containing protein [Hyphomicrobiales bacterium]